MLIKQTKQNKTKQNKTKQNKTKQNKTKRNETKQTKPKQIKSKQTKTKQNKTNEQTNKQAEEDTQLVNSYQTGWNDDQVDVQLVRKLVEAIDADDADPTRAVLVFLQVKSCIPSLFCRILPQIDSILQQNSVSYRNTVVRSVKHACNPLVA
jgi:signal recognition particle GTPase